MNDKELRFLQGHFRAYYQRSLPTPPDLTAREFGFGWQKKIDYRHKAFSSHREFQEFILSEAPLFVSYSVAYYEFPAKMPMSEKGFQGADLVFDLDKSPVEHDDHSPFFCRSCIELLHEEALRLKKMLEEDFCLQSTLAFSGQKGFHLHVRSEEVRFLSKEARRQIADYVSAEGLHKEKIFPQIMEESDTREKSKALTRGPSAYSTGWAKHIYDAMKKALEEKDKKKLKHFGLNRKNIYYVEENRETVLKDLADGRWSAFCDEPNFDKLLNSVRFLQADKAVTFDLSRLIRLPNSLHGATGFAAKQLREGQFRVEDTVVFDNKHIVEIIPREDLEFELLGKWSLHKARFEGVPLPVAIFLVAQEKAFLP